MSEHTPGPWIVGDGGKSLVVWSDSTCSLPVAEARRSAEDARLIAAAPELLAALKEVAEYCERQRQIPGWRMRNSNDDAHTLHLCRAAINKAEKATLS